jgi:DNA polymerase I-like protein with 3'-5' exonuclease and polymerase domains
MFKYITVQKDLLDSLEPLSKMEYIGFDVESTGLCPHVDKLILLQLGDGETQYIFDTRMVDIQPLKEVLEGPRPKVGHNLAFDYSFLKRQRIEPEPLVDVMLHEKILNTGRLKRQKKGFFGLGSMTERYLNVKLDKDLQTSFDHNTRDISAEQLRYAAMDVVAPLRILDKQIPFLKEADLMSTARLENNAIPALADMSYNGFYLDKEKWIELVEKSRQIRLRVKAELDAFLSDKIQTNLFGVPIINYASPDQLLFTLKRCGFNIKDTRNETLMFLENQALSKNIIAYRSLSKVIDSFGYAYLDFINKKTGRVHPGINQIGADSGRMAMSKPNLQQMVKKQIADDFSGDEYRAAWQPQNDGWILATDYSGEELRIVAEISGEESWVEAFNKDMDLHCLAALRLLNLEVSKTKNKHLRDFVKEINFGTIYGMNEYRLRQLYKKTGKTIDLETAAAILNKYFTLFPRVKGTLDNFSLQAFTQGYTTTLNGRRRYFDPPPYKLVGYQDGHYEVEPKDKYDKQQRSIIGAIKREARNYPIQGTGGDIIKLSLTLIRNKMKKESGQAMLCNSVHDENVMEYDGKDPEKDIIELLNQPMLEAEGKFLTKIPPEVESKYGKRWMK